MLQCFVLVSYIYTLGYLLGHLLSKASLLALLSLSLKILPLYFLFLLGLLGALRCLPPIALTMLQLRCLLSATVSAPLTPIYFANVYLASIILLQMVSQYSFMLYFSPFLFFTVIFTKLLYILVFVLASYIYILNYLLKLLFNKASLLNLLLLYFYFYQAFLEPLSVYPLWR